MAPRYPGLVIAQALYVVFVVDLSHPIEDVIGHGGSFDEAEIMLAVLGLVDLLMVANLLIMVVVSGHETFVSHLPVDRHPDKPEWLSHVNANVLKVKLAMATIGISSVHLLATFIAGMAHTSQSVLRQTVIHCAFIISALALAAIDRMYHPSSCRMRRRNARRPRPRRATDVRHASGSQAPPDLPAAAQLPRIPGILPRVCHPE